MSHGVAQARALVQRFVRALLDADALVLHELFAPQVMRLSVGQPVERERIVSECRNTARQLRFARELRPEDVVAFDSLEATGRPGGDIDVYVPVRPAGAAHARAAFPCVSRIVVRPGDPARIVAVGQ
jgi:hypothetical protein